MEAKPVRLVKFITKDGLGPYTVQCLDKPYKYSLKKWNVIENPKNLKKRKLIRSCKRGFHASKMFGIEAWLKEYYEDFADLRAFIVEVRGIIDIETADKPCNKVCAEKIKFIHEIELPVSGGFKEILEAVKESAMKYEVFEECELGIGIKNPYFKRIKFGDGKLRTRK